MLAPLEVGALRHVFGGPRDAPLVVGAVKSNIGHLEVAAGMAGLLKLILSLGMRQAPGNLHLQTLNPKLELDGFAALFPGEGGIALPATGALLGGVSSFGFGGTNASIVFRRLG